MMPATLRFVLRASMSCLHACMYACVHTCMHKDMDVYARVHVCVHVGMLTCMYVLYACTQGRTALHLAAANGHVDTVDVLLSLGAGDSRARSLDRYIHVACACACACVRVRVCEMRCIRAHGLPSRNGSDGQAQQNAADAGSVQQRIRHGACPRAQVMTTRGQQ